MSDQSQKEVADFLGIKVDTVKNRLRTARDHLKERLLFMVEDNLQENRPSRDEGFVDQVLRLIAPQKTKHSKDIYALFDALGRPELGEMGRAGRIADSKHDWKTSRVGFVGSPLTMVYTTSPCGSGSPVCGPLARICAILTPTTGSASVS